MRCLITGAAGQVAYSLIPMIGNGNAFGHFQAIDLVLFDLELQKKRLEGIRMEIEDSNFKMISSITCTVDPEVAFKDASIVIFIGSKPRTQGMNRSDLLTENKKIFFEQATLMKRLSKPDVKILVVGNPANCNALIIAETAKEIPRENITSLMRLDHNRVISAIALHKGIQFHKISNSFVFGNHSPTLCPCLTKMAVNHQHFPQDDTFHKWVNNSLIPSVRSRGHQIIEYRGLSSSFSAAQAICHHLYDWFIGADPDCIVSMGVVSDGSYGVPSGLVFGMPCRCLGNFKYEIVDDIEITQEIKDMIQISVQECQEEKKIAFSE